jgi:hypothetical protein
MNAAITRTCRASNTSVNPLTSLLNSMFGNALFEFHRSICDPTVETSILLTKVEELFEDHVQPVIGKFRKWGCDASPTFKYWDMFLVAVQIMLLKNIDGI